MEFYIKNKIFIISFLIVFTLPNIFAAQVKLKTNNSQLFTKVLFRKTKLENTKKNLHNYKKIDVFLGSGLIPFRIYTGLGYFISSNIESYIKFAEMLVPNDDYHIILGVKLLDHEKSTLLYTYEAGVFFGPDFNGLNFRRKLNGINFEGGFGYLLRFNSGFHIESDLKLGFLFQKHEKLYLFPVLDLSLGWTF